MVNRSVCQGAQLDIHPLCNRLTGACHRLTDIKAVGLFFRPKFAEQLTTQWLDELWKWYWTGGGVINMNASSATSYFGIDILSFAARYDPCPIGSELYHTTPHLHVVLWILATDILYD